MSKKTELLISKLDGMIQSAIQTALAELSGETLIEIAKAPTPVAYYAVNELGKRKPNLFKLYDELIIPRDSFIELYKKAKGDIVFGQEEIYNKELPYSFTSGRKK